MKAYMSPSSYWIFLKMLNFLIRLIATLPNMGKLGRKSLAN